MVNIRRERVSELFQQRLNLLQQGVPSWERLAKRTPVAVAGNAFSYLVVAIALLSHDPGFLIIEVDNDVPAEHKSRHLRHMLDDIYNGLPVIIR